MRFVQLDPVARRLRKRLARLRKGDTPESVGLGADVASSIAEQLMVLVQQQWCEARATRKSARRPVTAGAKVCLGITAMHYYITGRAFKQPGDNNTLSKAEADQIAMFGRTSSVKDEENSEAHGVSVERWQINEESPGGLQIERAENAGNGRLVHNQLIAVYPADARNFMLGTVKWMTVTSNFELRAGVRIMPGAPQAIAIRATGLNAMYDKFIQALALPAMPALKTPPTLILPTGWFKPKRVIEVHSGQSEQLMLAGLIERGADFERVSFEPA